MKILMVTMGLDIGGAETHILELSRELVHRGHQVLAASNGGVYVRELEECGIKHYKMPLNRKDPASVKESCRLLQELIETERPDIVHAHARIPGFIAGLVHKKVPFNFVTTAHWVFKVDAVNRRLTNWGRYTIAVSDDIKKYLIDEYDLRPDQIYLTINGIDMKKFSPDISGDKVIKEFGLDPDAPIVSYVSRMDESRALAARQLIEAAPALSEKVPGIQFLIAGGGDVFDELKTEADGVNRKLGRQCLVMTGARTDINEIVAAGDIFVGVSRAALEAMSAAKPAIIAGNEGYIGIFREDRLEVGRLTNFCCRGCEMSDARKLERDITALFAMSADERAILGEYCRDTIQKYYSAAKMADDYLEVYERAVQPELNILLSGYYGFRNAGDEAILGSIYENIMSMDRNTAVSVLVSEPEKNRGRYSFHMVDRFNMRAVKKAIAESDVVISGGGSLLQDRTSTKSLIYYTWIMNQAAKKSRLVMYANGIGPVDRPGNRARVRGAVEKAELITLRDGNSADELRAMGVKDKVFHVTADPVFSYKGADKYRDKEKAGRLLREKLPQLKTGRPFAAVSVRDWPDADPDFDAKVAEICDSVHDNYGMDIVFIVMQRPNDLDISRRIISLMKNRALLFDSYEGTDDLMGIVGQAEFILCMRLHTLIFAAHMGVPTLGIVYDPKVRDYLEMLDMPSAGDVERIDVGEAENKAADIIENREKYVERLEERSEKLTAAAEENRTLLAEFFDKIQVRR
ncbi:MAG: polysaccharide pyruvyl transferase CsaB [Anaerovoracaceae bacterium]|nr:polysaccharide pyruvyl transferase CsaB [Bacillota bacterium]MDY2670412.1 polysaccharide pyruvyl transferase CsaB [Anaerovoracaceae bacterium]